MTTPAVPEAEYLYRDGGGTLRYTVQRLPGKQFTIIDPAGDPLPNPIPDGLACLYRLADLAAAHPGRTIYVVEGEKDADTVTDLGYLAVSPPCGTRKGWLPKYTPALEGRHVAILPDADGPGLRHAHSVGLALHGVAASVVIVPLPTGRGPWDVTDWAARIGKPATELARLVARARYASAGFDGPPKGAAGKAQFVFDGPLTSREKLVLLTVAHHQNWHSAADNPGLTRPSARTIADAASLHRVTVANTLTALRRRGIIDGDGIAWDILAVLHQDGPPPMPEAAERVVANHPVYDYADDDRFRRPQRRRY